MKWAIQAKEEEKNKPQTFSADGWTGNQRSSQMWWRNEQELLPPEPRTARNKWAEWLGRGEREGDKGAKAFCPGWRHQPGQNGGILSRLVDPTGTKGPRTLLSRLYPPTGTKGLAPPPHPAYPASRWTRDKSHLLSRAQRLPGQMAWNKGLFCSSAIKLCNSSLHYICMSSDLKLQSYNYIGWIGPQNYNCTIAIRCLSFATCLLVCRGPMMSPCSKNKFMEIRTCLMNYMSPLFHHIPAN